MTIFTPRRSWPTAGSHGARVVRSATALLITWLTVFCPVQAAVTTPPPANAAQHALAALIAERTAELAIPPKTVVMPADLGAQTATEIKAGHNAAATRIANGVIARSHQQGWRFYPFNEYIAGVVRGDDPTLLQQLNIWLAQEPDSAVAHVIRAMYYAEAARTARGTETSDKVPDVLMKIFKDDMADSAADLLDSIRLNGGTPWSYSELERVSFHAGNTALGNTTFQQGSRAFPEYYPLYRLRLNWLTPQWGGSIDAMYSFVDQYAGAARPDSPLKLLYLDLYANLLAAARFQCYANEGDRGHCFDDAIEHSVRAGLRDHIQQALSLFKSSDPADFSAAAWPLLDAIACPLCAHNASIFGGSVLQMAADIMGSDNRLMDNRSRNSYMLDDITAHVWAQMGNASNADKKYHEALLDAKRTSFADPALKAQALATIYDHMATFADNTGQFADIIVYHDAGNAIAGDYHNAMPWMKCYAFYRLQQYAEAVEECTSLIEGHDNFLPTHYWRAKAYEQLGEWEKSIADFAPVAEGSDNWFRVGAALDMSYAFGQKGDYAGQLASMNGHAYLFDARIQPAHDLAVAYNNRCFAYMKLKQLRKALDDCTKSLTFDRLPDAFQKQQELLTALGGDSASGKFLNQIAPDGNPLSAKIGNFYAYDLIFVALGVVVVVLVIRLKSVPSVGTSDEAIRRELASGERLIWTGIPQQGLRLRAADAVFIPFSLVWGGLAFFWEYNVLNSGFQRSSAYNSPGLFAVWGIPFVLVALYLIVGRFFVDTWMRSRTILGVTDRRIMILTRVFESRIRSLELRNLGEMTLQEGSDGRGTISFGQDLAKNAMLARGWPSGNRRMAPAFEGVERVREVYGLIQRAIEAAHKRSSA